MVSLTVREIKRFRNAVYSYYSEHGRELPWRQTQDPYRILVSEIMLQQTQVERVLEKYPIFLQQFPSFRALADAPLVKLALAIAVLVFIRHHANIRRLLAGTEARIGGHA